MTRDGLLRTFKRRNCFIISACYEDGLAKGKWTTQKGALDALGVSKAELSLALKLHALPPGIIDLFESPTELTPYSVRVIRDVIAWDGLQTVVQRIGQQVGAGRKLPARAVLAVIKGRVSAPRRAWPAPQRCKQGSEKDARLTEKHLQPISRRCEQRGMDQLQRLRPCA